MAKKTNTTQPPRFHVHRALQGGWQVRKHRFLKAHSLHDHKDEAIEEAERLAVEGSIIYIHGDNGRIEERREV